MWEAPPNRAGSSHSVVALGLIYVISDLITSIRWW